MKYVVQFQASQARANEDVGHGRKANTRSKENDNPQRREPASWPREDTRVTRVHTERAPEMNIGSDAWCQASNSFLQVMVVIF